MAEILAVDLSSNNAISERYLGELIARGCQLSILRAYTVFEHAGLQDWTRRANRLGQSVGLWSVSYLWLYGSIEPASQVDSAVEIALESRQTSRVMMLDAETYDNGDGTYDPGPTGDSILLAAERCRQLGWQPVLYTAAWWIYSHFVPGWKHLSDIPLIYAAYDGIPKLSTWPLQRFGFWNYPLGKQYTSTPEDWSVVDLEWLTELAYGYPTK